MSCFCFLGRDFSFFFSWLKTFKRNEFFFEWISIKAAGNLLVINSRAAKKEEIKLELWKCCCFCHKASRPAFLQLLVHITKIYLATSLMLSIFHGIGFSFDFFSQQFLEERKCHENKGLLKSDVLKLRQGFWSYKIPRKCIPKRIERKNHKEKSQERQISSHDICAQSPSIYFCKLLSEPITNHAFS